MPGFFEALKNIKPRERPKPQVVIDGHTVEVSLEKFKEVLAHGQENFEFKKGKIVRKPSKRPLRNQMTLRKSKKGYNFLDGNPYWPKSIVQGGYEWQIEQE
jgi:hypothetical protein